MKKVFLAVLVVLLVAAQSVAACTIFAVGKNATVDGSTMTSHTCDSNSDDVRIWLIPSMEAGTERDVVVSGRKGADYSQFPAVKDYGTNGIVLDSYINEKATNQYVHAMYSFINDKGLAMGESTCVYDWSAEKSKPVREWMSKSEGIWDCYMLQDAVLENCSTAREAIAFMAEKIENDGWNGFCECINLTDGNETWVFEVYGGTAWVAMRVPDDCVFVAANRARIDYLIENDPDNCQYNPNIKQIAIENGLWNGEGEFRPNDVFCPNAVENMGCTLREWRAITLLNPELYGDLDPWGDPDDYPLFVKPSAPTTMPERSSTFPAQPMPVILATSSATTTTASRRPQGKVLQDQSTCSVQHTSRSPRSRHTSQKRQDVLCGWVGVHQAQHTSLQCSLLQRSFLSTLDAA